MEEICHSTQNNLHLVSEELQRPTESLPWILTNRQTDKPHDEPMAEREHKNYFSAPGFYCVETIYVHHVVLLLPGKIFQKLNHLPIF